MVPGIDPKVDYVFKRIFGSAPSAPILLRFLDAVLQPPPAERIVSLEIRDPFNPKETPDDKLSIVDVKARDERGRLYNIEMQMRGAPTYPDRVLACPDCKRRWRCWKSCRRTKSNGKLSSPAEIPARSEDVRAGCP
jgi:hypothetical protein